MNTQGLDPRILEATEKGDPRAELAAVRTGLAFERARQAADRTLMAILRTSLTLIAFGFGAFQVAVLWVIESSMQVDPVVALRTVRVFGLALILLGVGLLAAGIVAHLVYLRRLRAHRAVLAARRIVPSPLDPPGSVILAVALLLLLLGCAAAVDMLLRPAGGA
jgi:putative membrane protein